MERRVAPSTQNQALNALVFLYKPVLERPLSRFEGVVQAKGTRRAILDRHVEADFGTLVLPVHCRGGLAVRSPLADLGGFGSSMGTADRGRCDGAPVPLEHLPECHAL